MQHSTVSFVDDLTAMCALHSALHVIDGVRVTAQHLVAAVRVTGLRLNTAETRSPARELSGQIWGPECTPPRGQCW